MDLAADAEQGRRILTPRRDRRRRRPAGREGAAQGSRPRRNRFASPDRPGRPIENVRMGRRRRTRRARSIAGRWSAIRGPIRRRRSAALPEATGRRCGSMFKRSRPESAAASRVALDPTTQSPTWSAAIWPRRSPSFGPVRVHVAEVRPRGESVLKERSAPRRRGGAAAELPAGCCFGGLRHLKIDLQSGVAAVLRSRDFVILL